MDSNWGKTPGTQVRPVVVVTCYKRAARSRRRWRTSTSPAGALQVARVAEESERAFLLQWADMLGGER